MKLDPDPAVYNTIALPDFCLHLQYAMPFKIFMKIYQRKINIPFCLIQNQFYIEILLARGTMLVDDGLSMKCESDWLARFLQERSAGSIVFGSLVFTK